MSNDSDYEKLETIWKIKLVAYFKVLFHNFPAGLRKNAIILSVYVCYLGQDSISDPTECETELLTTTL